MPGSGSIGGGGGGSGAVHYAYSGAAGRGDVNFRALFQDFNASKFVVFSSLLAFSILYALKLDRALDWSWWAVFTPLWVWKAIAVLGALVGSCVWWRRPQSRLNAEEYVQYKAMLMSLATHLLLLMFELLVADNLESRRHLWTPGLRPPRLHLHPVDRHLDLERASRPLLRAGALLRCQHPAVGVPGAEAGPAHHLAVGDHLRAAVDRALHLARRGALHHHLCGDSAEDAGGQC